MKYQKTTQALLKKLFSSNSSQISTDNMQTSSQTHSGGGNELTVEFQNFGLTVCEVSKNERNAFKKLSFPQLVVKFQQITCNQIVRHHVQGVVMTCVKGDFCM